MWSVTVFLITVNPYLEGFPSSTDYDTVHLCTNLENIMAYIQRDNDGKIIAGFETLQDNAQEIIPLDAAEVIEYIVQSARRDDARAALSESDVTLIRVLEDLINTLIDQKVILFTDLPMAAREKLSNREKIRGHLTTLDNLMADDEGIL